jgi:multidrug efflux pump subunit AcrA (membrane-fusion protein)
MPLIDNKPNNQILYETRSEEVQEIIGRLPSWILRWGITMIGVLLCLLFVGAHYIKYPDKVMARVMINASAPPIKVLANTSGMIQQFLVKQNDSIAENDVLMIMDSKANMIDIANLKNALHNYTASKSINNIPTKALQIGELQNGYSDVQSQVQAYYYYLQHDASALKISQIQSQIALSKSKIGQLNNNQKTVKQNNVIDKQLYEADKKLFENGAITENEFLVSKKRWLDQQVVVQTNPANVTDKQQQQFEMQQSILSVHADKQKEIFAYQQKIENSVKLLMEQIRQWEIKYIIKAPVNGKVNLFTISQANQQVQAGQPILLITPPNAQTTAKGFLPIANAGEVQIGQKVLLDITTHPQNKYGFVEARISFISDVPMDSVYAFEMQLVNGLNTTSKKTIPSMPVMYAGAQIITKDVSVLDRLFSKVMGSGE